MHNKVILGAIGVIVLGLIVFFAVRSGDNTPASTTSENDSTDTKQEVNANTSTEAGTGTKSMADLMALGTNQKCTFSDGQVSGVTYVASGKARSDFTTNDGTSVMTSHSIISGTDMYVWVDGQPGGFKTSLNSTTQSTTNTSTGVASDIDLTKKTNYNCSAWVSDSSFFAPPTTVQFMDMTKIQVPKP